ncbi:MAG: hypothetical protein M3239_01545, partial [Thermoproteota archaeon]|nr:hypothetical protein [Thermoproteota archaeon]
GVSSGTSERPDRYQPSRQRSVFISVAPVNLCRPDSSLNTLCRLGSEANYREFIAARSILVMVSFSIDISRMTGNFFSCFFYGFPPYLPYNRDII